MKTFIIRSPADISDLGGVIRGAPLPLRVVVSQYSGEQTIPQRKYLEFLFEFIANAVHDDRDTIRELILTELLGADITETPLPNGKVLTKRVRRSSTLLDRRGMSELTEAVQHYAATKLGVETPDPHTADDNINNDPRYDNRKGQPPND